MWKTQYSRHNAFVRSVVPKDQLLEFNAKQGWGPLCEFLGKCFFSVKKIYAMHILSWILCYRFRLDSGDLGGWLIGAVRSFHTAEYGRAVQLLKVQ